jgi:hypothetical protein
MQERKQRITVYIGLIMFSFGVWCLIMGLVACLAQAGVTDQQAYKCLLGEVRGESMETIRATAHALRNRGTTRGVYGCNVTVPQKEMRYIKAIGLDRRIKEAWTQSISGFDVTYGATHWEGVSFKEPYWVKSMIHTGTIGTHHFYKEKQ